MEKVSDKAMEGKSLESTELMSQSKSFRKTVFPAIKIFMTKGSIIKLVAAVTMIFIGLFIF